MKKIENKKVTVNHMDAVYSINKRQLYCWILQTVISEKSNGNIKSEYDTFCYQLNRFFKITNKKPLKEKSKSLRFDYRFLDNTVSYAVEVMNKLGNDMKKEPLIFEQIL